ncbi:IQ and ubiquitin-like domain-containing protein isoform X2 [Ischnura elegans]|uniref:IQ and ubiquitin-like domain-containing protein isoform X2 n=1 Tax=Ischnura elegans TaxID=197161 RepID=UPI001ED8B633|nr:IQ and ubiquitin-like domain-containing protein isoform X2 [Ischnura elegans]
MSNPNISEENQDKLSSPPENEDAATIHDEIEKNADPQGSTSSIRSTAEEVNDGEKPLGEMPISGEDKRERIPSHHDSTSSHKSTVQNLNDGEKPDEEVVPDSTEGMAERTLSSHHSVSSNKNALEDVIEEKRQESIIHSQGSLATDTAAVEDLDDGEKQLEEEASISTEDLRERILSPRVSTSSNKNALEDVDEGMAERTLSSHHSVSSDKNALEDVIEGYDAEIIQEMEVMEDEIEYKMRKPFIGGYIQYPTKTEYHNATTNTSFLPLSQIMQERKLERSTQTKWSDSPKLLDTAVTAATQTPVRGLHLLEPTHTYITPRKFTEIEPIDDKVVTIQRWWRNWLKRKIILIYLEEVKRQDELWRKELDNVPEERQKLKEKLNLPVECLKTQDDFERAYYAIELERKRLVKSAQSLYSGQLLNFAYMYILLQEVSVLKRIDRQKKILIEEQQMRQCYSLLNELSAPRTWISKRDGMPISMETSTEREFTLWRNIYYSLTMTGLSSDQMRVILNATYSMLERHCSEEVNHIKDMIIQELVLLAIGVDVEKLKNSHTILVNHLFDHLESYALKNRPLLREFKLSRLKNRLVVCKECGKVKTENSFDVYSGTKELLKCKSCVRMENVSFKHKEYSIFRHILESLRKEEVRLRCSSPIAFIIQVDDINYLINSIWHTHSALSHKSTLEDLRLCRFNNAEDWSPWNCLLLTHEEVVTHRRVSDPYKVYAECLVKTILNKHKIAREYFKFLRNVSDRHLQTLEWLNVKKTKPYKYYNVTMPKVSYFDQPKNIKLNPSQHKKKPGVKCRSEIQRL